MSLFGIQFSEAVLILHKKDIPAKIEGFQMSLFNLNHKCQTIFTENY